METTASSKNKNRKHLLMLNNFNCYIMIAYSRNRTCLLLVTRGVTLLIAYCRLFSFSKVFDHEINSDNLRSPLLNFTNQAVYAIQNWLNLTEQAL